MTIATDSLWIVIVGLAVGSYLIRFSFLGLIGNRPMPPWLLRLLRYTGVAVLPALVTPLVLFPAATGGQTDPARLLAAVATVAGVRFTKNVLAGILLGGATLYLALWLF